MMTKRHLKILFSHFIYFFILSGLNESYLVFTTLQRTSVDYSNVFVAPILTWANGDIRLDYDNQFIIRTHNVSSTSLLHARPDITRDRLYIYEGRTASIYSVIDFKYNASYMPLATVHVGASRGFVRIAVDWVSNSIYWTEPAYKAVMVQSMYTEKTHTLIEENIDKPLGIAVDPVQK